MRNVHHSLDRHQTIFPDARNLRHIREDVSYKITSRTALRGAATLLVLCFGLFVPGWTQVFKHQQQALKEAFSDSSAIERRTLFLTQEEVAEIERRAKTQVHSQIVTYYVGKLGEKVLGYAFFETAIVRTKPATFMVVMRPDGSVDYVEILAFYEPLDYLPTDNWLDLFKEKILNERLWPKRTIHHITGATLTVHALTFGVRKILATFEVAVKKEESP